MRVLVFSKEKTNRIENLFEKHGFSIVQKDPDLVACWGGDGTLLLAEHRYPGVPKLALGKSKTCMKCMYKDPEQAIAKLSLKKYKLQEAYKFQAFIKRKKQKIKLPLIMNDIVLRNKDQMHAIRFSITAGKTIAEHQIGDGVVISTPFGSTAYFKSITRKTFTKGIGIAFNNTMERQRPRILNANSTITISLERGDGCVSIDTLEKIWIMKKGDTLIVNRSDEKVRIVIL